MNFARTNKEFFENELGTTSERISNASIPLLHIFFKMSSSLTRCSLLHTGCGDNGVFEKSEDKNLPLVWLFSRGISGVSTSTVVFKNQALTRRIGLLLLCKQWVFLYGVMDISTHLEIFQQESHFTTSEFAVIPSSVLDILLPAPFLGETTGRGAQFRREWIDMKELIVHPFVDHIFASECQDFKRMQLHPGWTIRFRVVYFPYLGFRSM